MKRLSTLALLAFALAAPAAAAAQDEPFTDDAPYADAESASDDEGTAADGTPERESIILVFGEDSCPESVGNDVVVCARRPEEDRYRIPRNLRRGNRPPEQSWAARVSSLEDASRDMRPNSCSTVGSYGQSGCMQQMLNQWSAERRARPTRGY